MMETEQEFEARIAKSIAKMKANWVYALTAPNNLGLGEIRSVESSPLLPYRSNEKVMKVLFTRESWVSWVFAGMRGLSFSVYDAKGSALGMFTMVSCDLSERVVWFSGNPEAITRLAAGHIFMPGGMPSPKTMGCVPVSAERRREQHERIERLKALHEAEEQAKK